MNNFAGIGRLTADIELRRTSSGKAVASFTLAIKRPRVADTTDFIEFVAWEQGAEYLAKYAHKGDIVGAVGTLQPREWTDKDGNKRKAWEVVTTSVELLSNKKNNEGSTQQNSFQGKVYNGPQQGYNPNSYERQVNAPQYNQQSFGGYAPIEGDDANLPF